MLVYSGEISKHKIDKIFFSKIQNTMKPLEESKIITCLKLACLHGLLLICLDIWFVALRLARLFFLFFGQPPGPIHEDVGSVPVAAAGQLHHIIHMNGADVVIVAFYPIKKYRPPSH